nr:MAG: hypothetical protein AM324_02960 [Candidatus Thorarchaeota archaeon SMTZ1-83]
MVVFSSLPSALLPRFKIDQRASRPKRILELEEYSVTIYQKTAGQPRYGYSILQQELKAPITAYVAYYGT